MLLSFPTAVSVTACQWKNSEQSFFSCLTFFMFLLCSLQFHSTPLYLEWAPMGVFSSPAPQKKPTEAPEKEGEASLAPGKSFNFGSLPCCILTKAAMLNFLVGNHSLDVLCVVFRVP